MKTTNTMNLQMFGGWDEVLRDPQMNTGKTEFTKLTNGVTELRFLDDEPFVRWAHWIAQAKRNDILYRCRVSSMCSYKRHQNKQE